MPDTKQTVLEQAVADQWKVLPSGPFLLWKLSSMKRHIIIGTAGHIDHGKTWLVKALTGTDTDRLAEEKKRGLPLRMDLPF